MKKAFLLLFVLQTFLACKDKNETIRPEIMDINESVYASGIIKAADEYKVYSSVPGIIRKKLVTEGQLVQAGQPLFLVENKTPEINVDNAQLAVELANENLSGASGKLKELQLRIQLTKDKMSSDSLLFLRQKNLWDQGIGTQIDFDQRKLAYESSLNNYYTAKSQYALTESQLKNEVRRAQNNYRLASATKSDYTVKSEVTGKVYDIMKEPGELANLQEPLALIGKSNEFYIEMQVDEYDIAKIKEGLLLYINMDSYKGKTFEAKITRIYPIMNERTRSFKVEAMFVKGPEILYPNLSVEANIIIQTKKNALTIPRNYLVEGKYVWISEKEKKAVSIGLSDLQRVEILSGIDTATTIFKQ
jgi:multidrug efflux pump subunit AcrA (membrane-fusion protein)